RLALFVQRLSERVQGDLSRFWKPSRFWELPARSALYRHNHRRGRHVAVCVFPDHDAVEGEGDALAFLRVIRLRHGGGAHAVSLLDDDDGGVHSAQERAMPAQTLGAFDGYVVDPAHMCGGFGL